MASDDLTIRILTEIRDQIAGTNQRLDTTVARLDTTVERLDRLDTVVERLDRLDTVVERLDRLDTVVERLDRIEARLDHHDKHLLAIGTEMVAVHGVLNDVVHVMKGRSKLESRVDRCEREIDELKRRLG